MTQMTFKEWWSEQPSLDYDEMAAAHDAWHYQQQRIAEMEAELARLRLAGEIAGETALDMGRYTWIETAKWDGFMAALSKEGEG